VTKLTDRLRNAAEPTWSAQLTHPFVTGVGDGSLHPEKFGFYLRQDYLYLIDYARVFAFCAAKSPDLPTMVQFSTLLAETIGVEMDLHRSFVGEFGITPEALESERKAPTCQGYTDFLLATAAIDDYPSILAALLPCMWGYRDVGLHLAANGASPDSRYQTWIEMYAGDEYGQLVDWCIDLMNAAGEGLPERAIRHLEDVFITSSRYELAFWEMAWSLEQW
jgi:thiaminase/transcriptional activator TenA